MRSFFIDVNSPPAAEQLKEALGETFRIWEYLAKYTHSLVPGATDEWKHAGKFGWGFRISDKKRVLIYLLPRDKYFKVAFVFGQKATDEILKSSIAQNIKDELMTARVYAEGRGFRIDVKDDAILHDVQKLIAIKARY